MNKDLFIRRWVEKEKTLEAEVLRNISRIKKLKKFQDTDDYWDLISSCWKYKSHIDRKQKAFEKKLSLKEDNFHESIEKATIAHKQRRIVTDAFVKYATELIDELEDSSVEDQRRWIENVGQVASKTRLNSLYKLWSDLYIWQNEDIVRNIVVHMGVYNDEIYSLRSRVNLICKTFNTNSEGIMKHLMNQSARSNKRLLNLAEEQNYSER